MADQGTTARNDGLSDPAWVFRRPKTEAETKTWIAEIAADIERHDKVSRAEAERAAKRIARQMLEERRTAFSGKASREARASRRGP